MSYDHMQKKIEQLDAEVREILAEAEAVDREEDEAFGADRRGDEVPAELARRETRLAKMREAMKAIEAEAKERTGAKKTKNPERTNDEEIAEAAEQAGERAKPAAKAQRNFTDPESRIMKTSDGSFHYAYNAQAVVDEKNQVVLAGLVTQQATDVNQLTPMIAAMGNQLVRAGVEDRPKVLLADAGYCSKDNLDALVATGRLTHDERVTAAPRGRIPKNTTAKQRMARRLRTKAGRADYARRKAIVEPAFGQMKVRQHAGHLRLRGLDGARGEWTLHLVCHNLRKLANAGGSAAIATA
jgi:hypothetical protein